MPFASLLGTLPLRGAGGPPSGRPPKAKTKTKEVVRMPEKSARKPKPKPEPKPKRTHCISVRLTDAELETLDENRGRQPRGTWCHKAVIGGGNYVIPECNRNIYIESARWAANLSQLAKDRNLGKSIDLRAAVETLRQFRLALLGANHEGEDK